MGALSISFYPVSNRLTRFHDRKCAANSWVTYAGGDVRMVSASNDAGHLDMRCHDADPDAASAGGVFWRPGIASRWAFAAARAMAYDQR